MRPSSNSRGEAGALVTPIPPSSRPQNSTTYTLPVSGSLTITATRRSPLPPDMHSPIRDRMEQNESEEHPDQDSDQPRPMSHQGDLYPARILQNLNRDQTPLAAAAAAAAAAALGSDWHIPERHQQYGPEYSCGRPFCKLKKKEHFHCQICNQAFSEYERLKPHLLKHATCGPMNPLGMANTGDEDVDVPADQEEDGNSVQPKVESNDHPSSPRSPINTSCFMGTTPSISISSPRQLNNNTINNSTSGLTGPQTAPQFPLVYTQAASFPGLPSPFGPHLGMAGIFPGSLPRMLPPAAWQVHPTLAAMAHQGLMFPGVRPNGDLTHGSPGPGGLSGLHGSGPEPNPLLSQSLGTSPHLAMLGKRLGAEDFNSQEAKKIRSNNSLRLLKDEPVPDGYIRFR